MYDGVNDTINYLLGSSALTEPKAPLDSYRDSQFRYGNWIFWRFPTERHTTAQAGLPTPVRDVFLKADDATGVPDKHSLQALEAVLRSRGRACRGDIVLRFPLWSCDCSPMTSTPGSSRRWSAPGGARTVESTTSYVGSTRLL